MWFFINLISNFAEETLRTVSCRALLRRLAFLFRKRERVFLLSSKSLFKSLNIATSSKAKNSLAFYVTSKPKRKFKNKSKNHR